MTTRVVVHAGFHKTGTTSIQAFFAENGPVLWPVMALGMRYRFPEVLAAARGYSTWRDPISLAKFRHRLKSYLRAQTLRQRDLFISSEELCGHLPGRGAIKDYSAAPVLMRAIEDVLSDHFPSLDLTFAFTLRKPDNWWRSAYWEHVRSSRMTLSYQTFVNQFGGMDLAGQVALIDVQSPIKTYWLEDIAELEFGPATPLIDLMHVPADRRAELRPIGRRNVAPHDHHDLVAQLLDLNRSDLDQTALKAAKRALLARFDRA